MVERYLCLMLSGKIHGIDLSKLEPIEDEDEVEEYHYYSEEDCEESRPPPPPLPPPSSFDFTIDLPSWDMQVFSLDSKIFLVGGSDDDNQPCYQIYEFQCDIATGGDGDGDDENKKAELNLCESIPKVPVYVGFYNSHIAWIPNEAYFLVCDDGEFCFWVLRRPGCGGEWERLSLNTIMETQDRASIGTNWFYPDNRLYFPICVEGDDSERVLCCFDLQTRQWTMEEIDYRDGSMESFNLCFDWQDALPLLPRVLVSSVTGLEDYTNYSVMLSYSQKLRNVCMTPDYSSPPLELDLTTIYAMLVNQNGVRVYQRIGACLLFKGIKPYFTHVKEAFFVDLGQGKTCAILFGFAHHDQTKNTENIVLCVSIFTLSLKDGFDITTNSVESWNKEQTFLSVRVLSSHVYTIKENLEDMSSMCKRQEAMDYDIDIQRVFVFPPP